MPWLMDQVEVQLDRVVAGRTALDGLIRAVVNQRLEAYGKLEEASRQGSANQKTSKPTTPPAAPVAEEPEAAPLPETVSSSISDITL